VSLADWLLKERTPKELAKELAAKAHENAALKNQVHALEYELFWKTEAITMTDTKNTSTAPAGIDQAESAKFDDIAKRLRRLATNDVFHPVKAVDASVLIQAANCIESLRAMFWNYAVSPSDATGKADAANAGEAHKLAQILWGMCEGGGADRDADIYAEGYQADDGDVYVRRAGELLIEQAAEISELVRYIDLLADKLADQSPATSAADAKDAERYQFACSEGYRITVDWSASKKEIDETIDAAIAASRKGGEQS
jgi:hypothetical protein